MSQENVELAKILLPQPGRLDWLEPWATYRSSFRSRGAVGAGRSHRLLKLRDTSRAMSQENVEIVRRAIDSFNHGRLAMEDIADDFEMDWSNSIGPNRGVYRGREQLNGVFQSFREAWDMGDTGGNRFGRGTSAGTGVQVWTIRNGKLASVKLYQSKDEALEALGLSQ